MNWLKGRFKYALSGLKEGVIKDDSIRLQFVFALMAIALSAFLKLSALEWLLILLAITLVISFEIFNSCLEKTVDYISLKKDPRAKLIKDMAAGAVFIVSCFALITAIIIWLPKIIEVLNI